MSSISGFPVSGSGLPLSNLSGATMLPAAAPLGKGQKAAREFEAQLIGTVLQSMEKTFASVPGQEAMPGEDNYNYMGTQAFASAIVAGGGFGIARMIAHYFESTKGAAGSQAAPGVKPGAQR
jgi:Rod binding domain-containing protein